MAKTLIHQIDAVQLAFLDKDPVKFYIEVKATASTPGWSQIELKAGERDYDDIYVCELVGVAPSDYEPQVLSPVMFTKIVDSVPEGIKGIKVIGKTNSVIQKEIQELPDPGSTLRPPENYPQLATLYGIYLHKGEVKIRVYSGGCTQKDDFQVQVDKSYCDVLPYRLAFYRKAPDYCDGYYPTGTELSFDLDRDLNIPRDSKIEIVNPLVHHPKAHPKS